MALTGSTATSLDAEEVDTPEVDAKLRRRRGAQLAPEVTVIGAGCFGAWASMYMQRAGTQVTMIDQYGPANSRSTSGGETRGVRSSYGDRIHGPLWAKWAIESMGRWKAWDEEHADGMLPRLYFETGDIIIREEMEPYLEQTMANWDALGVPYEVLTPEEVRHRWPVIATPDIQVGLYEPGAGVVRARRAIESVAQVFQREGGEIQIGKVQMGDQDGRTLHNVLLADGTRVSSGTFVFALGPWFPMFFPELMGKRMKVSTLGHTYYFRTPPGDESYRYPNLPSYSIPRATGWPALGPDSRGFRIRTGGHSDPDPDASIRWIDKKHHENPRSLLRKYFPALADAPINETRSCHYESSVDRNFFIDRHPDFDNVWVVGGGSAEAFKQGPVLGDYIAGRVLGTEQDPELIESFRLKEEEFEEEEDPGQ